MDPNYCVTSVNDVANVASLISQAIFILTNHHTNISMFIHTARCPYSAPYEQTFCYFPFAQMENEVEITLFSVHNPNPNPKPNWWV